MCRREQLQSKICALLLEPRTLIFWPALDSEVYEAVGGRLRGARVGLWTHKLDRAVIEPSMELSCYDHGSLGAPAE